MNSSPTNHSVISGFCLSRNYHRVTAGNIGCSASIVIALSITNGRATKEAKTASSKGKEAHSLVWLNKDKVAYLEPNLRQSRNPWITRILTTDSRNKQGYDFLIFSPPEKKKPYPVIFYHGVWHHLKYD